MKISRIIKIASPFVAAGIVTHALKTDIVVNKFNLIDHRLPNNLRIVFISDLHNNLFGEKQADLIGKIAEQKPDLVLLGGDFFDTVGTIEPTIMLLEWLGKHYPTYFVTGNHEFTIKDIKALKDLVRELNITVLDGKLVNISSGTTTFTLSGVDDSSQRFKFRRQLSKVGKSVNSSKYNILLSHRPEKVTQYEKYDFDLVLSGHAHGGQFRLPGLIDGLYSPGQGFFPPYTGGQYNLENETMMIVNRGLMIQHQKLPRIFNPPEIIVIDLMKHA